MAQYTRALRVTPGSSFLDESQSDAGQNAIDDSAQSPPTPKKRGIKGKKGKVGAQRAFPSLFLRFFGFAGWNRAIEPLR